MAPLSQSGLDELTARIMKQLSETNYACSFLTRLTNGTTNFVFRGILSQPLPPPFSSQDHSQGHPVETVIIKHTASFVALNKDLPINISLCVVEASILNLLNDFPDTTFSVKIPHLYLFDENTNTQVLEDIPGGVDSKTAPVSPTANVVLSRSLTTSISYALGAWLRSFHSWTSARS
ncbi:hypothetical protein F4818DRAFT_439526 [Hypoxylon cercidicola]|nr:hypothetical protein F4818DRAFT_439526 [Hypoxylon cercidicola]